MIFGIASLFALVFGYSKSRAWKIQSEVSRKNYKREKEIIEKTNKAHVEDVFEAHEVHDKAHEENVLSFEKKKEELRRLLDKPEADPKEIADFLDEMGIDEE